MNILISENENFTIQVYVASKVGLNPSFSLTKDSSIAEAVESFTFKKPAWGEAKLIMSAAVSVSNDGEAKVDPYKLMDARIKILLKSWTLKDIEDKPLPVTDDNIDKLPSSLITLLGEAIGESSGGLI